MVIIHSDPVQLPPLAEEGTLHLFSTPFLFFCFFTPGLSSLTAHEMHCLVVSELIS